MRARAKNSRAGWRHRMRTVQWSDLAWHLKLLVCTRVSVKLAIASTMSMIKDDVPSWLL